MYIWHGVTEDVCYRRGFADRNTGANRNLHLIDLIGPPSGGGGGFHGRPPNQERCKAHIAKGLEGYDDLKWTKVAVEEKYLEMKMSYQTRHFGTRRSQSWHGWSKTESYGTFCGKDLGKICTQTGFATAASSLTRS